MEPIDFSKLPAPLPAEADSEAVNPFTITPQNQPVVQDLGQPFDMSGLPEPLPVEPEQRGTLADMGVAAVDGVSSAVREVGALVRDHTMVPPSLRGKLTEIGNAIVPEAPKPETVIGKIESDLVRFGLGFLAGGAVVKGSSVAAQLAKSAVGTGMVADAHAERLSNIVESYPSLSNPISEYLAAKDDDSTAVGKFKAALEDVLTNSVAQLAFKTFKVAKGHMSGKINDADASAMAEDILKTGRSQTTSGAPKSAAAPVVDASVKAEQARQAVTPAWSPLKLSDEKAVAFKEKLDSMFKDRTIEATPANDGTVSVAHMQSGPDVLNTVSELSKMIAPEMRAVGFSEHQTNIATRELAEQLSMDQDALLGGLKAAGVTNDQLAPMIVASRMAIQGQAANIARLAQRSLNTGEGKAEAITAVKKFAETLSQFKTLQTGTARGLQSFSIKVGQYSPEELATALAGKQGDALLKLVVMAEADPTVISKLAQAAGTSGLRKAIDTHNEVWINALLSGPKTHMVNMASTSLNLLTQPLNLVVGGSLRREWSDVREGIALWTSLRTHLFDSFDLARKSFLTDTPTLSPKGTNEVGPAISSTNYNLDPESVVGQATDWLGKVIRLPTRFLGAEDEFFKNLSYRSKLSAQAAREGADLLKAGKLTQDELAGWIADRFAKGLSETGAALDETALKYAEKVTFTSDLKTPTWLGNRSFGESLQTLASTHPVLRGTVLPFVRVPANLMRQVTDMGPAALVTKRFYHDLNAGGQLRTEAIGKISLGSMMWAGAAMLAVDGTTTGAAPTDKDLRKQLEDTGWRPYSLKINGQYISYSRADPFGAFLGLSADYVAISGQLPDKERENLAAILTLSVVNNLTSKSYLKGAIDTLSVIGSNDEKKMHRWLMQRASSYMPSAVGALNPDRELKDVRSVVDAFMSKVPGYSGTLPAQRGLFGEKRLADGTFPVSSFNPFPSSTEKNDLVRSELARLATGQGQAQFTVPPSLQGNVDLKEFKDSTGRSAYDKWLEGIGTIKDGSGRDMHRAMLDRISSDAYQRGTDGDSYYSQGSRVAMLRTIHDRYKDLSMQRLTREMPEVAAALRADKQNRLMVRKGREAKNPIEALRQFGEQ